MSDKRYRTVHVPEDPAPAHTCRPENYEGDLRPVYKDRTILECNECGIFWWATVFSIGKGTYTNPVIFYLRWRKVRWYHFKLRKYTR